MRIMFKIDFLNQKCISIRNTNNIDIYDNEIIIILNDPRNASNDGIVLKFEIDKDKVENIRKSIYINDKFDFTGCKTYMYKQCSKREEDPWVCINDPKEDKNGYSK